MTETLVVIVFIATIFTFIYISVIPLIGIYEDKSERENDIDIVYKLYNIKQLMEKNSNTLGITSNNVSDIKCEKINNLPEEENYCNKLMDILGLTNYELYYVNGIKNNINLSKNPNLNSNINNFPQNNNQMINNQNNQNQQVYNYQQLYNNNNFP